MIIHPQPTEIKEGQSLFDIETAKPATKSKK